jgi:hypothetical protein
MWFYFEYSLILIRYWQHCSHSLSDFVYWNHMGSMAVVGMLLPSGSVESAIGWCAHDVDGSLFSYDVEVFP